MPQILVLQTVRTIPFVAFIIASFHSTTLAATSLSLAHTLARHLETFVIFEARCVPNVSITLITGDPSTVLDAWRNGRAGITLCVAHVLLATATTLDARGAHVPLSHGRRQVRDDVVMLTVLQQVDPLVCGYLTVKHDVVASQT
jgi:hypothetical protein